MHSSSALLLLATHGAGLYFELAVCYPIMNQRREWQGSNRALDECIQARYIVFMKLRLIVEKDSETGRYSSVFPELPGCASAGDH